MTGKTTIAALSGMAVGVALTLATTDGLGDNAVGGVTLLISVRLFPMVAVTVIAMVALKRWMNGHEARNRQELTDLTEARRRLEEEHGSRLRELATREAALNRSASTWDTILVGLARRLDEAESAYQDERYVRGELQQDYDELAADHNQLIQQVIQERADAFNRRTAPVSADPTTRPSGKPPCGSPLSLIRLRSRGQSPLPQHEHSRAAEGVGDAG